MNNQTAFNKLALNRFKFNLFMLANLPMGFIARLRIDNISEQSATVSIPYYYATKNPFRSMYFAAQSMAAEMSTAALAMGAVYKSKPAVSMLVIDLKATFTKKAATRIKFVCNDGEKIMQAVENAKLTGEGQTVEAKTQGFDDFGDLVSEFFITWTFKVKK